MLNIVCEGADGSGKSTLVANLSEHLTRFKIKNIVCRHPGSTKVGQEIRNLVKHREDITISRYTEQVLMAADLCMFIESILRPSTEDNTMVISDRSNLISGMIYGLAGGLSWDQVQAVQDLAMTLNPPQMVLIILHGNHEVFKKRQHHDVVIDKGEAKVVECKFEKRGNEFHKKVIELYNDMANPNSSVRLRCNELGIRDVNVIDATQDIKKVSSQVLDVLRKKAQELGLSF